MWPYRFEFAGIGEIPESKTANWKEKLKHINFKGGKGGKGGLGGLLGGALDIVGDVVGAITGADQTNAYKDLQKAQAQAQQAALQQQKRENQLQEQEQNKANSQAPQYTEDGFYDSYNTDNVLTGNVNGLSENDYTLGKNSLLGVRNR